MSDSVATLETPRLLLRKAIPEDTESLCRSLWSRPEAARHMLWQPTATWEEARQRMSRTIAYQREHLAWTVCEKATGRAIGFAGITPLSPVVYEDTGLALSPDCWRQGYGREVLEALANCCFHRLGGEPPWSAPAGGKTWPPGSYSCPAASATPTARNAPTPGTARPMWWIFTGGSGGAASG